MKPTRKQLAYLKRLAEQTGTTFAYPTSSAEASAEIQALRARPRNDAHERSRERRTVAHDMQTRPDDATAVRAFRALVQRRRPGVGQVDLTRGK